MDPDAGESRPPPTGYVSPYGKPAGLARRLAEWADRMGTDRSLPWAGTGIIEDLKLAAAALNKREWLEAIRLSDDPEAQRFAAEALDDDETYEAANDAAAHVTGLPDEPHALEPVETIEKLDARVVELQRQVRGLRDVLEQSGVVDDETPDDDLPAILRALLS